MYTDAYAVLLGLRKDEVVVNQTSIKDGVFGGHVCFNVQISLPVLSDITRSEEEINAQKLAVVLNNRARGFSKRVGRLMHRWLSQFYPAQLVWDVNVLQGLEDAYVVPGPPPQPTTPTGARRLLAESQIMSIIPKNLSEVARTQYVSNGVHRSFPMLNNADMIINFVAKDAPLDSDRSRARLVAMEVCYVVLLYLFECNMRV